MKFLEDCLFWRKIFIIKIEAHAKTTKPEYQGNALADFPCKGSNNKISLIGCAENSSEFIYTKS